MNFESVSVTSAIDIFLLLLIGIGPKIALVPFLEATADMPAATKGRVVRKMLTTATSVAVVLLDRGGQSAARQGPAATSHLSAGRPVSAESRGDRRPGHGVGGGGINRRLRCRRRRARRGHR